MSDVHLSHPSPQQLTAYPRGQLGAAEAAAVAAHLAECPACRAALAALPVETMDEPARGSTASAHPGATGASAAKGPSRPAANTLPEQFGPYRITRLLGRGGMGSVYLAHDPRLDRPVALKVPHFREEDGPYVLERFYREARAAARIEHPNICQVYEVSEHDGMPYLAMRYVEGKSLAAVIRDGKPLGQRQAAALVGKLAVALQVAHAAGVIHRDLKPSNVMLLKGREPIIMDFGLARQVDRTDARLTKSGAVMGTPAYMAPEQAAGDPDAVGPASDVYSLGVILYELLTGRLPFEGPVAVVLALILVKEPERPSALRPDLDPQLEAICCRAMAKKPAERFATMAELAAALSAYLRGEGAAPPTAAPSAERTASPGAGAPARTTVEAHGTYRVTSDEAAPTEPTGRPSRTANDSQKGQKRKPARKKPRARAPEPQPSAVARWLVACGTVAVFVAGAVLLAVVLRRGAHRPGTGPARTDQVAALPAAPAPENPPADAAPGPSRSEQPATLPAPNEAAPGPTGTTNPKTPPAPAPGANPGPPPRAFGPGAMAPGSGPAGPLGNPAPDPDDPFLVRLAEFGRATTTRRELAGKALTAVLVDVDAGLSTRLAFDSSSPTLLTSAGKEVPALVVFLPNGRDGLRSAHAFFSGRTSARSSTDRAWRLTVGGKPYSFEELPAGTPSRDTAYQPAFLQQGWRVQYVCQPNQTVRIGFLFESAADRATRVRVAGQDLALEPTARQDGGESAADKEPAQEARPAQAAVEVYKFAALDDTGAAASRNLTVTELADGRLKLVGRSNSAFAVRVTLPRATWAAVPLLRGAEQIVGADIPTFSGPTTIVPDTLGSTNLYVEVNREVGRVTLAGLQFKDSVTILSIRKDGVLIVNKDGVRATDAQGGAYVSRSVRFGGKVITTMVRVEKK